MLALIRLNEESELEKTAQLAHLLSDVRRRRHDALQQSHLKNARGPISPVFEQNRQSVLRRMTVELEGLEKAYDLAAQSAARWTALKEAFELVVREDEVAARRKQERDFQLSNLLSHKIRDQDA